MNKKNSIIKFVIGGVCFGVGLHFLLNKTTQTSRLAEPAQIDDEYEKVDAFLSDQMVKLKFPGAFLAIVEGNKIIHARGFGAAQLGGEKPSAQTPFFIGSLTKSFTALAVMQLVEAGKIELDAPVKQYLPWFKVANPLATEQMRVRHLLNQTGGLSVEVGYYPLADMDTHFDANERQMRKLATYQHKRPVGSKFEYCNANFNLLGLIIESVSGDTYANYIQKNIFNPLRMKHSYSSSALAKKDGLATGHRFLFWNPLPISGLNIPNGSLPSGQLICSAEDLGNYLMAHLNGGVFEGQRILTNAGMDELHRGEAVADQMGLDIGKYAMGWFDSNSGQTRTIWHTGNVPDFSAYISIIPEQKKGVVLLINAGHFMMTPIMGELGGKVSALVSGDTSKTAPGFARLVPWMTRLLLLIPLFQLLGFTSTLRQINNWRKHPQQRPDKGSLWRKHLLLPLIPNLTLIGSFLFLIFSGLLGFLKLFFPDFVWITFISGSFAMSWTFIRTRLILRVGSSKL